jgi:arsenite transporter/arsenate reductase (thioredoxin)
MHVLGLQGSPRKNGNTAYLLAALLSEAQRLGAETHIIDPCRMDIRPCRGCGFCEKKGRCVIENDAMTDVYHLFREADIVVAATPVYFFGFTAQLKMAIDRSQTLWSRKYVFKLSDPAAKYRQGFLLSMGGSRGKALFDGVHLTARYFFDAIDARYHGSLTYAGIEGPKDMKNHPTVLSDVEAAVPDLLAPFQNRKRVLFACPDNACASPMAAAFATIHRGAHIDAVSAGTHPAAQARHEMVDAMAQKGIDMAFHRPRPLDRAIGEHKPDIIVAIGGKEWLPDVSGAEVVEWELTAPAGPSFEEMGRFRDQIEKQVMAMVDNL